MMQEQSRSKKGSYACPLDKKLLTNLFLFFRGHNYLVLTAHNTANVTYTI
jgi:hypothetical protein